MSSHQLDGVLHTQEVAADVDVDRLLQRVDPDVGCGAEVMIGRSIAHEDVQAPVLLCDCIEGRPDLVRISDVACVGAGPAALMFD